MGVTINIDDDDIEQMRDEAQKFHGLYAGQFEPSEYRIYIQAGVLRKTWKGVAGQMLGLATLEVVQ